MSQNLVALGFLLKCLMVHVYNCVFGLWGVVLKCLMERVYNFVVGCVGDVV